MKKIISTIFFVGFFACLSPFRASAGEADSVQVHGGGVYLFDIMDEIGPAMWRTTMKSIDKAVELNSELVVIHMNTYGGMVDAADSIRTKILNCPIPVYVFVDNNAISAGALIAIACDKIYMREGASIGAATVVNQSAEAMPDKYQSFMRSMMRATAEAHGRDTIITGHDTVYRWRRDPLIAEAMVDPRVVVPGVIDSTKVLTMTVEEAIKVGYCEGKAETIEDVIADNGMSDRKITRHTLTALDKVIHFLMNPYLHSILIMLIIGGIYYELQTPGIGFPLAVAVIAALLYFAPLYLEGIAAHWELALFILGLILVGIEIFALPGFGVAGISGIILIVVGLSLAAVDNLVFEWDFTAGIAALLKSICVVLISAAVSLALSIWGSRYFFENRLLSRVTLQTEQRRADGYLGVDDYSAMVGLEATARSVLRPAGKIEVGGKLYDAVSELGFINAGESVRIVRCEAGQVYVMKANSEYKI